MSKSTKGVLIMVALGTVIILLAGVAILLNPVGTPMNWGVRATAIVGYVAVFLAVLSSAYMRELYRTLGRPFLWGHHVLSISGLVLLTLHPLILAIEVASAAVFIPRFDSLSLFLQLGGRPALYLMFMASLGAVLRKSWKKNWRTVHQLNYIAFLLGTVHAVMIGTDFSQPFLRVIPIAMALAVSAVFVHKRLKQKHPKNRKKN
ncbi:MAG: ferric reductase [Anaerolineae bacterium]|nr:ferric reductase [Anaerolineae bacterium]